MTFALLCFFVKASVISLIFKSLIDISQSVVVSCYRDDCSSSSIESLLLVFFFLSLKSSTTKMKPPPPPPPSPTKTKLRGKPWLRQFIYFVFLIGALI